MNLDYTIGVSLAVLAVCSIGVLLAVIPLALQLSRVLGSIQHLIDLVLSDIEPAIKGISNSITSVNNSFIKCKNALGSSFKFLGNTCIGAVHTVMSVAKSRIQEFKE